MCPTFVGTRWEDHDVVGYDQVRGPSGSSQRRRIQAERVSRGDSSVTASLGYRIATDSKRILL